MPAASSTTSLTMARPSSESGTCASGPRVPGAAGEGGVACRPQGPEEGQMREEWRAGPRVPRRGGVPCGPPATPQRCFLGAVPARQ